MRDEAKILHIPRIPYGCSIYITTRCNHRCRHCYLECSPSSGDDMSESLLRRVIEKSHKAGLLRNVTIVGGEPFIDVDRLVRVVSILVSGYGVLEIFIPTNGRWVLRDDYFDLAGKLEEYGRWVPYELRIAFSENKWNFEQLGRDAVEVSGRWSVLEREFPRVFRRRTLVEEDMTNAGRAKKNVIARPGTHIGAHCSFDDWVDPVHGFGFFSDYLSFWPDATSRVCYAGGPIIGSVEEDFHVLLHRRSEFLCFMKNTILGNIHDTLPASACEICCQIMDRWQLSSGEVISS